MRKSKRIGKENSFANDFYTFLIDNDPQTYYDAISSFDALLSKEDIKTKINSTTQNRTWILVDLPLEAKPIGCK